jgi:hypothetical protein
MIKKRAFLLVALLLFNNAPVAFAAAKAGDSCKVIGVATKINGKSYKCVLLKGKKVLQLTQATKNTKSNLPSKPAAVSYTTLGLSSEISLKAFNSITTYLDKQPELSAGEVILELSPKASKSLANATFLDMQKGFRFWQSYTPRTTKIRMVFADRSDLDWFKSTMIRIQPGNQDWLPRIYDLATNNPKNAFAGSQGFDSEGNALFFYLPGTDTTPTSPGWQGVGPHEWTHFAQLALSGDIYKVPCWFKEGQATYYGNAISNKEISNWAKISKNQIGSLKSDFPQFYDFNESTLRKWFSEHELDMPNNVCGPDGAFVIGALATEYLAGTIGVEGIHTFETNLKSGMNWKDSLSQVTGKSFEPLMDEIVSFTLKQRIWSQS